MTGIAMGQIRHSANAALCACHYRRVLRSITATGVLVLALAACSSAGPSDQSSAQPQNPATKDEQPAPRETPQLSRGEMVQSAIAAVEGSLPDAPIWKGMTFAGTVINDSTVCVDRTWRPGGGIDRKGGSAGYTLVTFPGKTLGEPTDGACSDVAGAPTEEPASPVVVPDNVKGEPGLVTRIDLGTKWPLTVEYGIVSCQNKTAGGRALMVATFTDPSGTVYALNGTAKDHGDAALIDPIWAPDPDAAGLKIDIGPLIERALDFC